MMCEDSHELSRIETAINKARLGWTLCFIGEDQSKKLAALTQDLRADPSSTGDGKKFASGFSYWGIGPTIAWARACSDPFYLVMKDSIDSFPERWVTIQPSLSHKKYHYVSLGVGTGHKDWHVLDSLRSENTELSYFPVDMSPEMLRVGIQESTKGIRLDRHKVLPVQIDFSIKRNAKELRKLLDEIVGKGPVLFSLLGNTLANFEDDVVLLKTLCSLIRVQDRLLLEVAWTNGLDNRAINEAASEYEKSIAFKNFAMSALLQNTDLRIDQNYMCVEGLAESDRAICIKTYYQNKAKSTIEMMLPDRTTIHFPKGDTIRLYLSRKYTDLGIDALLRDCKLSTLCKERSEFYQAGKVCESGMELILLERTGFFGTKTYKSVFISYGGPDQEFATKLNSALISYGVRTFFFPIDAVAGDKLYKMMLKGVNEFERTILVCSKKSLCRPGVLNELDLVLAREAREGGRDHLVPITLDDYVFDKWEPDDRETKNTVLDRVVADFRDSKSDDRKFKSALADLLNALR
jgi:uncharacterized SAM-dependent methyltransferase